MVVKIKNITIKSLCLFTEAWVFIALARLILIFIPFKKIIALLGQPINNKEPINFTADNHRFNYISIAIARASRYSFWRTRCFEQALCAKFMLNVRKQKSIIYFGVDKREGTKLSAHAWLVCDGEIVTGGKRYDDYTVIARFQT